METIGEPAFTRSRERLVRERDTLLTERGSADLSKARTWIGSALLLRRDWIE